MTYKFIRATKERRSHSQRAVLLGTGIADYNGTSISLRYERPKLNCYGVLKLKAKHVQNKEIRLWAELVPVKRKQGAQRLTNGLTGRRLARKAR